MKKTQSPISLKSVTNSDVKFLFDLLKERDPRVNISHKKMPTYSQHTKFIKSKPYSKWYIILKSKQKIGSIYLSKNDEIGIFLSKKFQGKNVGNFALNELMKKNPRKRFLANVNPKNKKSISFFKNNNFKLIQYTFEKAKRK
jgi:RimJ/RimL family protein N-acetyltransferase|tara:strand:+ start:171 stop:596 length:426 start_codon:yes stop_codon:yes gene_type:complete